MADADIERPGRSLALLLLDLVQECSAGTRTPSDIAEALTVVSRNDSALDQVVLSDTLIDTLFLYDVSFQEEENESTSTPQRKRLGDLARILIDGDLIIESDALDRLESSLLSASDLIGDAKAFEKRHVKINTNQLYRQQKFNLFREENEGYSKLIVEFDDYMLTAPNHASEDHASELLNNLQSIIGYFDLDPNRVLDVLIELAVQNLISHWRLLLLFFKRSPWFAGAPEPQVIQTFGAITGSKSAAQIIGFKFQQIRDQDVDDAGLAMLCSLLMKESLIALQDLWPHLSPPDELLAQEKIKYQNQLSEDLDKAKGRNALAMAGGLDDDPPVKSTNTTTDDVELAEIPSKRPDNNQKLVLVEALVATGAITQFLFVLAEYPFLLNANNRIADSFNTLLENVIEPIWKLERIHNCYPVDTQANLQQYKRVPEEPKYRDSALVLPVPPRIKYVLNPHSAKKSSSLEEVFFYDQITSRLTQCTTHSDFETIFVPLLRLAGVQIHRNVKLFTKIARIGKSAIGKAIDRKQVSELWTSIVRSSLIPALSLIDANPAAVNDIYSLIRELPYDERYALYGEWSIESYRKIPELKIQFVKTEKETKNLLRRISKTNTKEYGRRLAKVSHSNPCIVLNIALNQIESYDNLVDVVIEASRYFTLLTFDVLVYVLLTLLSNTQKQRLKEDGTSVAHWLQSLSSFTAKIFRRYSHMDPSPICIYVAKQLKLNNAFDLIILRDLITEMAGLRSTSDLSEEQLSGCNGGPTLRVEALSLINERRDPSGKVPLRLLHALDKVNLTYPLLILISQRRGDCVYNVPEESSLVKLLGNIADETHQILLQYLDFLHINADSATYASSLTTLEGMVQQHNLEPVIAFMIARPVIQDALHKYIFSKSQREAERMPTSKYVRADREPADGSHVGMQSPEVHMRDVHDCTEASIEDPATNNNDDGFSDLPILPHVADSIVLMMPSKTWSYLTPKFLATFWSLSLYDLVVPKERYEKELATLRQQDTVLNVEQTNSASSAPRLRSSDIANSNKTIEALENEQRLQLQNLAQIRRLLLTAKDSWFDADSQNKSGLTQADWLREGAHLFVQDCLLPRCLVSPADASFAAQFLQEMYSMKIPNVSILNIYQALFSSHIATIIFTATERESENLGRFYRDVLKFLNTIIEDEPAYSSQALRKCSADDEGSTEVVTWSELKHIWYGFHRHLWSNIKGCFLSKEYMHIRNALIVLEKMNECFPYFKWIGTNTQKEVDSIVSTEHREDLKIRALGYKAVLKRNQSRWRETKRPDNAQLHSSAKREVSAGTVESEHVSLTQKPQNEGDTMPTVPEGLDTSSSLVSETNRRIDATTDIPLAATSSEETKDHKPNALEAFGERDAVAQMSSERDGPPNTETAGSDSKSLQRTSPKEERDDSNAPQHEEIRRAARNPTSTKPVSREVSPRYADLNESSRAEKSIAGREPARNQDFQKNSRKELRETSTYSERNSTTSMFEDNRVNKHRQEVNTRERQNNRSDEGDAYSQRRPERSKLVAHDAIETTTGRLNASADRPGRDSNSSPRTGNGLYSDRNVSRGSAHTTPDPKIPRNEYNERSRAGTSNRLDANYSQPLLPSRKRTVEPTASQGVRNADPPQRSLASRMSSDNIAAPHNAPDGPRQARRDGTMDEAQVRRPQSQATNSTASEHFIHPSRQVTAAQSQTQQPMARTSRSQTSQVGSAAADPPASRHGAVSQLNERPRRVEPRESSPRLTRAAEAQSHSVGRAIGSAVDRETNRDTSREVRLERGDVRDRPLRDSRPASRQVSRAVPDRTEERDLRPARDLRGSRESRDTRDVRDAREPRDARDVRERDAREVREVREVRDHERERERERDREPKRRYPVDDPIPRDSRPPKRRH